MKILFIDPCKSKKTIGAEDLYVFEPLALEYIAAGVSPPHEVEILDMRFDQDLLGALSRFSPDIVGVTGYITHTTVMRALLRQVKAFNPRILTVAGGYHATVAPEDFADPAVDLIVIGPGIETFKEIVERYDHGKEFHDLLGIAYLREGELITTPSRSLVPLDSYPLPLRRLTEKHRKKYSFEYMKPMASIKTSFGCPARCTFCSLWKVANGKYLSRSPELIVSELDQIEEPYVFFADDESMVDARRLMNLADLIAASGIRKRYFFHARSDTVVKNPDLFRKWAEIGLSMVFIGFESYLDQDLEAVNKKTTVSINTEALRLLRSYGVDVHAMFMLYHYYEKEHFRGLARYIRKNGIEFPRVSLITPFPGTQFYEEVKDQMITQDRDTFDFIHTQLPTRLPLKEFYKEYSGLLTRAMSLKSTVGYLSHFPLRDIPGHVVRMFRVKRQVKRAYREYEGISPNRPEPVTRAPHTTPDPDPDPVSSAS